jgi:hypothetical protein
VLLAKEKNEQQGMTDKLKLENVIKWKWLWKNVR